MKQLNSVPKNGDEKVCKMTDIIFSVSMYWLTHRPWTRNSNVSHRVMVTTLFHNLLIRDFPLRRKQFTTSDWRVYQARKGHNSIISTHWYLWTLGNVHRKTGEWVFYHVILNRSWSSKSAVINTFRRNGNFADGILTYIFFNGNV